MQRDLFESRCRPGDVKWIVSDTMDPLSLTIVEAVEQLPPEGVAPLRWVLYTTEPVTTLADALTIIEHDKQRWAIVTSTRPGSLGVPVLSAFFVV
jgi:hypothetical protein